MTATASYYSEEHHLFREACRRFVAEEIAPHHARWEKEGKVDREAWRKAGEAGMLLTNIPVEYGGGGADFLTSAIFIEEMMGHVFTGPGFRLHSDIVAPYILNNASEDLKRHWLPKMASGEAIGALAMTEPGAGSDAAGIRTHARKDGDGWILNGAKCFIGNASRADWILVWATIDPSLGRAGHRAFFVEQGTPGLGSFKIEKKMGLKAYESTSFTLEDCRVPAANLLGGEESYQRRAGFKSAMGTFNAGRPAIAANAVGMGRAVLDEALVFARASGLLGDARVRDRLEHIARKLRLARLVYLRAGWLVDQRRPNIMEASMSKALGAAVAQEAATFGMELLGAVGGRGDHLIEKLYRDVKAMDIVEGTGEIQHIVMARHLVQLPSRD